MTYSPPDIRKLANTFTEDQTIETLNSLLLGSLGTLQATGITANGAVAWLRNARYDGTNYVRTVADNEAQLVDLQGSGDLIFYTNSDAGTTVGSIITWVERWRLAKDGTITTTGDQTIATGTHLRLSDTGLLTAATAGAAANVVFSRNARWTGTVWVRTVADNDASRFVLESTGDLVFETNSDAGATVGSTITWTERFRITRAGEVKFPFISVFVRKENASQVATNNTDTAIQWVSENWDTSNFHDNVTNTTRLTAPFTGRWRVTAQVRFNSNATGARQAYIKASTGNIWASKISTAVNGHDTIVQVTGFEDLAAGGYVEIFAFQDSGADRSIVGFTGVNVGAGTWAVMEYVGS